MLNYFKLFLIFLICKQEFFKQKFIFTYVKNLIVRETIIGITSRPSYMYFKFYCKLLFLLLV